MSNITSEIVTDGVITSSVSTNQSVNSFTDGGDVSIISQLENDNEVEVIQFSGIGVYTAGDGLTLDANEFSVDNTIARINNPTFTGLPSAPTAPADTSTTQIATTAFAKGEADAAQAAAIQRVNHTGTQPHTTITGLGTLATQSGTFSGTSSGTNTGDQTITLTGDVSGSGTGSFATTLKNVGTAGTYNNSATSVQPFTTDAAGRISSVGTAITITPSWNNITNTPTTVGNYGITDAVKTNSNQTIDGVKTFNETPHVPNLTVDSSSTSVVNKAYADNIATSIHVHAEAHLILKTSTLAGVTGGTVTYTNGTNGVGAKLTVTGGSTAIDALLALDPDLTSGVNGSRVIIANETNAAHNGIYFISAPRELTRTADADTPVKLNGGDFVFVTHGTSYANTSWICSEPVTIIGTSPVIFLQFSGAGAYDAGTGLTRDGTIFNIANTGVNATSTSYGSGTTIPVLTVNPQGQITAASTVAVTVDSSITDGSVNPVSGNAVFDAMALKAPLANPTFTGTVGGITKSMVGLANVDNTSDANKPVSTAQQTALNLKAPLNSPSFTGTVTTSGAISVSGIFSSISTSGNYAGIFTTGDDASISTNGANASINATGVNGHILSRNTFKLYNGTYTTTLSHSPTADRAIAFPNKAGTVAMTSDITGTNSGTNTGDETVTTIKSKLGITTLSGSNTGDQDLSGLVVKANNLSDLTNTTTARTNLGLGTLATQSGTFSGTSSGTNTGDQDLSSYALKSEVTAARNFAVAMAIALG